MNGKNKQGELFFTIKNSEFQLKRYICRNGCEVYDQIYQNVLIDNIFDYESGLLSENYFDTSPPIAAYLNSLNDEHILYLRECQKYLDPDNYDKARIPTYDELWQNMIDE